MLEDQDDHWMELALKQALFAYQEGQIPVGAVLVDDRGECLAKTWNRRHSDRDPFAHAEVLVMREASAKRGDWRFERCTLYVTLEPCPMCAGAMLSGRLGRLVFGASSPKQGCVHSKIPLLNFPGFPWQVQVEQWEGHSRCSALLERFFREIRS